jgi:hypothetical protein
MQNLSRRSSGSGRGSFTFALRFRWPRSTVASSITPKLIQFFAPKIEQKYFDYVHREMFCIRIAQQMPRIMASFVYEKIAWFNYINYNNIITIFVQMRAVVRQQQELFLAAAATLDAFLQV